MISSKWMYFLAIFTHPPNYSTLLLTNIHTSLLMHVWVPWICIKNNIKIHSVHIHYSPMNDRRFFFAKRRYGPILQYGQWFYVLKILRCCHFGRHFFIHILLVHSQAGYGLNKEISSKLDDMPRKRVTKRIASSGTQF